MRPTTGLYAVTPDTARDIASVCTNVTAAIAGGARMIQYRDKSGDRQRRQQIAHALAQVCRQSGTALVVNDDVELAVEVGAGVHIGREDTPLPAARVRLGQRAIIGVSCYNDLQLALAAEAGGANYVAFGSFFPSPTKPLAVRATLDLLRQARRRLRLPLVAIGGITPENGSALISAGADMLAVISGVFAQPEVTAAALAYSRLFPEDASR